MAEGPETLTEALGRACRVLVAFAGVAVVGVLAAAPALLPVYLGFEFGQRPQYAQFRELIALGGILVGGVVAFVVTRPVFAVGAKQVGKRAR